MEQIQLNAVLRSEGQVGKEFANRLRKQGFIPAVIYKKNQKTVHIVLNTKDFTRAIHSAKSGNVLVELTVKEDSKESKPRTVIIKEVQHHPYKDDILHVDFDQIALDEAIKIKVPIVIVKEAIGVLRDSGVLERIMWELEIECLPTQIPQDIQIDVSGMEVGHVKTVEDLKLPAGIKVLSDPEQIVVSVAAKKAVEEVTAPAEAEAAEPEVIREKKVSEEEPEAEQVEEKKPKEEKK